MDRPQTFSGAAALPMGLQMAVRLVLIDDHPVLRQGLSLLLERAGHDVLDAVGTVLDGGRVVREKEPDVVVIDVYLGDGTGIELTRKLLAERPERRVVLYTGSDDLDLLLDGLDSGARAYVLKEGAAEELLTAIDAVSIGDTYVDPRLRPALLSLTATRRQPTLSDREREIMQLLAEGMTGEEIADRLVLSAETIKTHVRNAMVKLEARNRVHAIALALRAGQISLRTSRGAAGVP
jgi:DNA-binding NarL/FixJ family response regulator